MIQEVEEPSVTSMKNSEYFGNGFFFQVIKKIPQMEKHYHKILLK